MKYFSPHSSSGKVLIYGASGITANVLYGTSALNAAIVVIDNLVVRRMERCTCEEVWGGAHCKSRVEI